MKPSTEKELLDVIDALPPTTSPDELIELYDELIALYMVPEGLDDLLRLDPFGPAYRSEVLKIYSRLSAREDYIPSRDEVSISNESSELWKGSSPFIFDNTSMIGEFLVSWGGIFKALDMTKGQSVVEYGAGSGHALIMLARAGMKAFGVDIDPAALHLLRRQSDVMGLDIELDRAEFGQGFEGQRFDRILFFQAFHHCLDFENLLLNLHGKLNPGGRMVLSGEPITPTACEPVPYPWGPRVDGASIFCTRRFGWMELGFTLEFFTQAMMRNGWSVTFQEAQIFRAHAYVARPIVDEIPIASDMLMLDGWGGPEQTHRWTIARQAKVPLPTSRWRRIIVTVSVVNYLGTEKDVLFSVGGESSVRHNLQPGERARVELTVDYPNAELIIETEQLSKVPGDARTLGIAVKSLKIRPID